MAGCASVALEDFCWGHLVKHVLLHTFLRRWLVIVVYYSTYYCYSICLLERLMAWEFIILPRTLFNFLKLHISVICFHLRLSELFGSSWISSPSFWERSKVIASPNVKLCGASPLNRSRSTYVLLCGHVAHSTLFKIPFTCLFLELPQWETIALIHHNVLHHLLVEVLIFLLLNSL